MPKKKHTKAGEMQKLVHKYKDSGNKWPAPAKEIAAWAMHNGLYEPKPHDVLRDCAESIAEAMRLEHFEDPQGRSVRKWHALRLTKEQLIEGQEQTVLWLDIESDPPEYMKRSFQQRRGQILGDCKQLKTDIDSYNDNYNKGESIQLLFDFEEDLAEMEQPAEYIEDESA